MLMSTALALVVTAGVTLPPVLECRLPELPPLCPCCRAAGPRDLSVTTWVEGEPTFDDGKLHASIEVIYDDAGEYGKVSSGHRKVGGFQGPRLPGPQPQEKPIP